MSFPAFIPEVRCIFCFSCLSFHLEFFFICFMIISLYICMWPTGRGSVAAPLFCSSLATANDWANKEKRFQYDLHLIFLTVKAGTLQLRLLSIKKKQTVVHDEYIQLMVPSSCQRLWFFFFFVYLISDKIVTKVSVCSLRPDLQRPFKVCRNINASDINFICLIQPLFFLSLDSPPAYHSFPLYVCSAN